MFTKDERLQIARDLHYAAKNYDRQMLEVWSNVAAYEGMEAATVHPRVKELERLSKNAEHMAKQFDLLAEV
jgi:hypothetical protein